MKFSSNKGFTLVELMITMAISLLLAMAATFAYQSQVKSYVTQESVSFAQQNLKACQVMIADDLRLAGYNPPHSGATIASVVSYDDPAHPIFSLANGPNLTLSFWDDAVGPTGLQRIVTYGLYNYGGACGGADAVLDLGRTTYTTPPAPGGLAGLTSPVSENIIRLEFQYTMSNPNGVDSITLAPPPTRLNDIKSITVTLLSQAHRITQDTTDLNTYTTPFGTTWGPFKDGFKRRLQTFTVSIRN